MEQTAPLIGYYWAKKLLVEVNGEYQIEYVHALLRKSIEEAAEKFAAFPEANPWHICFAIALGWGHLAKLDIEFTGAVIKKSLFF